MIQEVLHAPVPLEGEDENAGEDHRATEQQRAVLLDLAALETSEQLTDPFRPEAGAVHRAVDNALVDGAVEEIGRLTRADADAVDDSVDDVLVEPVRRPGDGPLDVSHDDVRVQVVEVVLVDE